MNNLRRIGRIVYWTNDYGRDCYAEFSGPDDAQEWLEKWRKYTLGAKRAKAFPTLNQGISPCDPDQDPGMTSSP